MTLLEMKRMEACCAYAAHVKMLHEFLELAGCYRADSERSRLHQEMCDAFDVAREYTTDITGNLDKINFDGRILYDKLSGMSREDMKDEL